MNELIKNIFIFFTKKDNLKYLLIGLLAIFLFITVKQCEAKREYKLEVSRLNNNLKATNSELENVILENGTVVARMRSLSMTLDEMKKINRNYRDSLNLLKNQEPITVTEWETIYKDTLIITPTYSDSIINLSKRIDYRKSFTEINIDIPYIIGIDGVSFLESNVMIKQSIWIRNLTIKDTKNGEYFFSLESDNPNIRFITGSSNVVADFQRETTIKKRKQFGIGLHVGANFLPNEVGEVFRPTFSVGLNYTPSFLQF